jgi:hypothetical protein
MIYEYLSHRNVDLSFPAMHSRLGDGNKKLAQIGPFVTD